MSDEERINFKSITVSGQTIKKRKLIVWRKTFEMTLKRFALIEEVVKGSNGSKPIDDDTDVIAVQRHNFKWTYPSLAACTTAEGGGKVPTEEECYQLFDEDRLAWIEAVKELNSDWLPSANETEEAILEKKE
jgi:hypothetical protein